MALNINIASFSVTPPPGQNPVAAASVLDTPNLIDQLINEVDTRGGNPQQKFIKYLSCLSQTLSLQGRLQGECESKLKAKIFNFTKDHAADAKVVIKQDRFKDDSKLKPTIEKVDYLASSYLRRYVHHLKNALGDNKRSGVSYLTFGLGFVLGGQGLQTVLANDPNKIDDNKINVAWSAVATGAIMIAYPILNPARLALQDEPLNP